jgi:hypothetical protein
MKALETDLSDRKRPWSRKFQAKKGTGGSNMDVITLLGEILQRIQCMIGYLHFVEDNQVLSGADFPVEINRKLRKYPVWIEIPLKKLIQIGIFFKVAINDGLVLFLTEFLQKISLSRLPSALQQQRLSGRRSFPSVQLQIKIPFHGGIYIPLQDPKSSIPLDYVKRITFIAR